MLHSWAMYPGDLIQRASVCRKFLIKLCRSIKTYHNLYLLNCVYLSSALQIAPCALLPSHSNQIQIVKATFNGPWVVLIDVLLIVYETGK